MYISSYSLKSVDPLSHDFSHRIIRVLIDRADFVILSYCKISLLRTKKIILRDEKGSGPRCVAPRDSSNYLPFKCGNKDFFLEINFENINNNGFY